MAVNGINLNSEAACRKAYLNYHCQGNTMGLSNEDMGQITQVWKDKLSSWQASASSDENQYEFDDSEFENSKAKGKQAGKDATGYNGKQGGDYAAAVGHTAAAAGGVVAAAAANVGSSLGIKVGAEGAAKILGKKGAEKAGEGAAKKAGAKVSAYIAAGIAIATAAAYHIKKPNKVSKEACDKLQDQMAGAQSAALEAQDEMEAMGEELMAMSDEANDANEEANEYIEEQKAEYDLYMESYTALKEKAESGEPLTDSEKKLYEELITSMTETGEIITETTEETSDNVNDIYDDMGSYQDGYDYAAETVGEIEGLTDYAESFDKSTKTLCNVEGVAQTLNAASGLAAGVRLFAGPWWNWIIGAASMAAAGVSGLAAKEQFQWAGEVGTEIDMRKDTQDLNAATNDMYAQEVDNYDGWMSGVEDLEIEIPDDVEPPEDTPLPQPMGETPTGASSGFGIPAKDDEEKVKEKEEPKK